MKKTKLIFIDIIQLLLMLALLVPVGILQPKSLVIPLTCTVIFLFISASSFIPEIWNIPININKLNEEEKLKVINLMQIIILTFKIIISVISSLYCVDIIFDTHIIFYGIIMGTLVFCITLLICVHKIFNYKK